MNSFATIPFLIFLALMGLIILAAFFYERSPWRWCPDCRAYWHKENTAKQSWMPSDCDGICKIRVCPECEQNERN